MTTKTTLASSVLLASLSLALALPASAQTTTPAAPSSAVQKGIAKADKEISARIDALNKLLTRVGDIRNLTDADKSTLSAEVQAQITTMTNLKAKIDADTDAATLKTDLASITVDYRIYALVVPQTQVIAAADRLKTVAGDLSTVGTKLQTRMTAAQGAGNDITSLQTTLTDMQAKLVDAQTQAQAAVTAVASLAPDQGDTTKAAANASALKGARADLKAGTADVVAARKDAGNILKALRAFKPKINASTTPTEGN